MPEGGEACSLCKGTREMPEEFIRGRRTASGTSAGGAVAWGGPSRPNQVCT